MLKHLQSNKMEENKGKSNKVEKRQFKTSKSEKTDCLKQDTENSDPNNLNAGLRLKWKELSWWEATAQALVQAGMAFPTQQAGGSWRLSLTAQIQPLQYTPFLLGLPLKAECC